jgi:hypothetical protein
MKKKNIFKKLITLFAVFIFVWRGGGMLFGKRR